jgi:hypothetical protein
MIAKREHWFFAASPKLLMRVDSFQPPIGISRYCNPKALAAYYRQGREDPIPAIQENHVP